MEFPEENVPNYLVQSILVTVFGSCISLLCLPIGVTAIVFSSMVKQKLAIGDFEGALNSSKKAKLFCWVGFGVAIAFLLAYIIIISIFGFEIFNSFLSLKQAQ